MYSYDIAKPKFEVKTSTLKDYEPPKKWVDFARQCKIKSGAKIVNFEPYKYQKDLEKCISENQFTMLIKTRQIGVTETVINIFLKAVLESEATLAVVFSRTLVDSHQLAKRIRRMVRGLGIEPEGDALSEIKFKGKGRILFKSSGENAGRGLESVTHILYDECAFIDDLQALFVTTFPTTEMVGEKAKIVFVTTPAGKNGFYWELLSANNPFDVLDKIHDVRSGKEKPVFQWVDQNGWAKFIVHWKAHPVYSKRKDYLKNKQEQLQIDEAKLLQEYDLFFGDAQFAVFSSSTIYTAFNGSEEKYDPDFNYYLGIDTKLGGSDYCTGMILKELGDSYHNCFMYRSNDNSSDYHLRNLIALIEEFQPKRIGIEVNNGGYHYYEKLIVRFPQMYIKDITTTHQNKPISVSKLKYLLEQNKFTFFSKVVRNELLNFADKNGSLEASSGHDDTVMGVLKAIEVSPLVIKNRFDGIKI